jgi:hypothetical protein
MVNFLFVFASSIILFEYSEYVSFNNIFNDFEKFNYTPSESGVVYLVGFLIAVYFLTTYFFLNRLINFDLLESYKKYTILLVLNFNAFATLIFIFRITGYSRSLYFVFIIFSPILLLFLISLYKRSTLLNNFLGTFFIVIIIFPLASSNSDNSEIEYIKNDCKIFSESEINNSSIYNSFFVVGHAYGAPDGENIGLAPNFINYLDRINLERKKFLILTGDFNRINDIDNLTATKNQIEEYFNRYYVIPGNHETMFNNNYYKVFSTDFFELELSNSLLIGGNFNNSDWLPSIYQQNQINKAIRESESEIVILFSHQIFWLDLFINEVAPNSDALLNKLDNKPLDWLTIGDKKLIVISGDHGAWGDELFCRTKDSVTFIANGLGNTSSDTILEVFYTPEGLIFNKVRLNTK